MIVLSFRDSQRMFNSFFLFGHCFLFIGSLLGESISNDKPPIGQLYSIKGLDTTYTQHFANESKLLQLEHSFS